MNPTVQNLPESPVSGTEAIALPARESRMLRAIGWVATGMAIAMYVAYIPQIQSNLHGQKGDWLQPLVAAVNCTLWVSYAAFRKQRDWPIIIANLPGLVFGLFAFATAL